MSDHTRRVDQRVPCRIPVEVRGKQKTLSTTALDVSRTGVRLQIPLDSLRLPPLPSLGRVALRLSEVIPEEAVSSFQPEGGGADVTRRLRVVRIVRPRSAQEDVVVGCTFDAPLSAEEAAGLGVDFAQTAVEADDDGEARSNGQGAAQAFHPSDLSEFKRTYIVPRGPEERTPFQTYTEFVSPHGIVVRVRDVNRLDLPGPEGDVAAHIMAFSATYGSDVTLRVLDGTRQLWTGPARLENAEMVPDAPHEIRLGFAFTRELWPKEREALRLN
ncbi:MAG: PilZ domain-containing protein [Planctomycetota bacterium]|jgi:hypothetical protein